MDIHRREFLKWPLGLAALAWAPEVWAKPAPWIVLQPLSATGATLPSPAIAAVARALNTFFAIELTVAKPLTLPRSAYYAKRRRYRAERLLDFLVAGAQPGARVTLGLTDVDISTSKGANEDWGVLGLATLDGRSAVLSSFRCRRGAKDAAHVRQRFAKTAVHELGHSFGLEHCPVAGCIMHDGEGSVLTTDTEHDLCPETRARLAAQGVLRHGAVSPFAQ